jgi:DNA (cytosine-5)-methyltransferase 1
MSRPRLLDLFCGAGGCSAGYAAAGFDIVGVDLVAQLRYPFRFVQADALAVLADREFLAGFAAIHASPPCQAHARVTAWRGDRGGHVNLLTPTLEALSRLSLPWVVENVPEAPIRPDHMLCGTQFGLQVRRHRAFQVGGWSAYELLPPCQCRRNPRLIPFHHKAERAFTDALGCDWMTTKEGRQAVPPVFTEHIGRQLIGHLLSAEVTS